MITLHAYSEQAIGFAIYPRYQDDKAMDMVYPTLGLCGECGEYAGKVVAEFGVTDRILELGDIAWYLNACTLTGGWQLYDLTGTEWPVEAQFETTMRLNQYAGGVAEQVKKLIRGGEQFEKRATTILDNLRMCYTMFKLLCEANGSSVEEVMQQNLEKLTGRAYAGNIHGDGDHR